MLSTIWEWIRNIASIVAVLSFVVEFTPIKLHPLTFVFHKLGGAFNKDLNEKLNSEDSEAGFGFGTKYCDNEEMIQLVREKIEGYRKEAEKAAALANQMISHAISFVRESSKSEGGLFSGFMSMLGKDHEILRVLSFQENKEYSDALKEMACLGAA